MKKLSAFVLVLLVAVLAACSGQTVEPTPTAETAVESVPTEAPPAAQPTEAPSTEPAAEPTESIVDSRPHTADPQLIDKLWQWERRDPNGNAIDEIIVPNPEDYTLFFNEDGTFETQLDCNSATGVYATTPPNGIFMELGATTLMACPEDSLSDAMMQTFGPAQSYRVEEDGNVLALSWAAGGPVDYYRYADSMATEPTLTGVTWQWAATTTAVDEVVVQDPSRYTVLFNDDGSVNIQADCNVVLGSYTTDDAGALSITLGPSTLAACPPDSQDQAFLTALGAAAIYFFEGDNLLIDQFADAGTMRFEPAAEPTLVGPTWQWLGTVTPVEEFVPVDPAHYLITFNEDGTANVVADCNNVIMGYETDDSGALTLTPGPSTLVACAPESLGSQFVQQLGAAALYFFEGQELFIDQFADGGTMRFSALPEVELPDPETGAASGTVNAPDGIFLRSGPGVNYPAVGTVAFGETGTLVGVSEDGAWYLASAPDLPGGEVWVASQYVDAVGAENLPVVAAPAEPSALTGTTWQWASLTTPVAQTDIADPSRYTITFNADGSANIQADCNVVLAQYTVDGSSISIVPGPTTLAACPPDSQDQLFIQSLSNAAIYFFQGGELYLDLFADGGTMRFVAPGTSTESGATGISGGAAGVTFRVASFGPAGAETPVIAGSTITALFDDTAAIVSGNAGCNDYTGTLNPANGFFTVGPIATTLRLCDAPAGVMDQETAYLAALGGTTGYRWEQDRTNAGALVTAGQIFYTLVDGTSGVINFVSP